MRDVQLNILEQPIEAIRDGVIHWGDIPWQLNGKFRSKPSHLGLGCGLILKCVMLIRGQACCVERQANSRDYRTRMASGCRSGWQGLLLEH